MLQHLSGLGLVLYAMRSRLSAALGIPRGTGYYRHVLPGKDEALRVRIETVMQANPGASPT